MNLASAARLLGMKESEIIDVSPHEAGTAITTKAGTQYLHLDEADHAGNTGLVFLVKPETFQGDVPAVYTPEPAEAGTEDPSGQVDVDVPPVDLDKMARADLDAYASERYEIDTTGEPNKAAVIARILAAEAGTEDPSGQGGDDE